MLTLSPFWRKSLYALSVEVTGLAMATAVLSFAASASAPVGLLVSVIMSLQALIWNLIFNALFERWEARQPVKGRTFTRRASHAILFNGGLTLATVPVLMWMLQVGPVEALAMDLGLTLCYTISTYAFTCAFDRLFGLPQSAL